MTTLFALHGFSQNACLMREQMGALGEALEKLVELKYLEGPRACPPSSVERLYAMGNQPIPPPPHREWWNASDDGEEYEGWSETEQTLRKHLRQASLPGLLGFSQGAIVATALAALAQSGEMPPLAYVILIGGAAPRAKVFAPYLERPLRLPSLHICGERDFMRKSSAKLLECFEPSSREVVMWPGAHRIPNDVEIQESVLDFVRRHRCPI
jgi:dihydrofolate reductase